MDILRKGQQLTLMRGGVSIQLREDLIQNGLPAAPDQDQRPPVDGLHDHQVPHQGYFCQCAGTAGEGERRVTAFDQGLQPFNQRFLAPFLFHLTVGRHLAPILDIFAGHADDMSARLRCAA